MSVVIVNARADGGKALRVLVAVRTSRFDRKYDRPIVVVVLFSEADPLVADPDVGKHVRYVGCTRELEMGSAARAGSFEGIEIGRDGLHVKVELKIGRLDL